MKNGTPTESALLRFFMALLQIARPARIMPRYFIFILLLFSLAIFGQRVPVKAASPDDGLRQYVRNGGYMVLNHNNEAILACNQDRPFLPASIVKIVTSLAGIKILGKDYRFATGFYLSEANDLYITGYGDPYLVSEEITAVAGRLTALGLREIRNIYLDDQAFRLENYTAEGTSRTLNPYDVTNGALIVNFNTVNLEVSIEGVIRSAEPQTPTLPLMKRLGRDLPPGIHRINITTDENNSLQYAGELFRELFKAGSIKVLGTSGRARVPDNLQPLYVHRSSKDLSKIIEGLMLYSNNFIANQLFLTCGAMVHGYPATWEKARQAMQAFLGKELGLDEKSISLAEGSGISRKNRVTPRAMTGILKEFAPYASLLALEDGIRLKSGTLSDVFSYAGYFQGREGPAPFVLILNQRKNSRDAALRLLRRGFAELDARP
jgi:D-alanyl-D-alanine carboxypeptidase/D-alanyl-D-alanine-endopeptidase (penicillin-binding protein 4)